MLNEVTLIGNLGKKPEVRKTDSGKEVMTFSLATTEYYKNVEGVRQDKTTWHNIVKFGNAKVAEYIDKGSKVCIEGKINNRSYEKDGVTKYISEVMAHNIIMLDPKKDTSDTVKVTSFEEAEQLAEDGIPF